ncbi:MAG: cobalamin biosynthesis protein CbiM [Cyanobacteria bacterium QS_8_64_29]|nr:MAG: cobalamin biosynthesis protein CbiM [Cyanobacteria bacterium QS_8_64_29]
MHVPDGIVPPSVAIAGYALTGGMTWYSLRQIDHDPQATAKMPKASLLTAAFFVASLIHIPIPPSSVHLVLNGLVGIVLGYFAFPAIAIGLFFQAVFFQHGGLSTLGINAAMMGIPAVGAYYTFQLRERLGRSQRLQQVLAFGAGAGALATSALVFTVLIVTTVPAELNAQLEQTATLIALGGYAVQAVIEGLFTVMLVSFFQRVKPELLEES